jgi:transposase
MKHSGGEPSWYDYLTFYDKELPEPIGPWGWAVQMVYVDLLVQTAALTGCPFDDPRAKHVYRYNPAGWPDDVLRPKWMIAQAWLMHQGLMVTPTLQVVRRPSVTIKT